MSPATTRVRGSSWRVLLPLLVVTLAATAWVGLRTTPDDPPVGAVVRPRVAESVGPGRQTSASTTREAANAPSMREATLGELRIDRPARQAATDGATADPFARIDWNPPPPPPPTVRRDPPPPPRPVAPPIPYAYFGMSVQDGRTVVFVTRGERTFVLTVGEVVENQYRVEEIRPPDVVLTYLPLNERQVMKIGTVQP